MMTEELSPILASRARTADAARHARYAPVKFIVLLSLIVVLSYLLRRLMHGTQHVSNSKLPPHPFDDEQRIGRIEMERVLKVNVNIVHQAEQFRARQRLLFKHLAKAGGTAVISLLRKMVPHDTLTVRPEAAKVTPADRANHYVIGLVREPCSNYVSLWSYGSYGHGEFHRAITAYSSNGDVSAKVYYGEQPPFVSTADVARFRAWMDLPAVQGIVTGRFLNGYSANPHVDCWILTEHLADTLRWCLRQYQLQGGRVAAEAANITDASLREASQENASPHGPCKLYYDARAAAQVQNGFDRALYRAFNWTGCCGEVWRRR